MDGPPGVRVHTQLMKALITLKLLVAGSFHPQECMSYLVYQLRQLGSIVPSHVRISQMLAFFHGTQKPSLILKALSAT